MPQEISVQGLVATTPRHIRTDDGIDITSFRLASSDRKYDWRNGRWTDGQVNWYTITLHNQIAINAHKSINKGDRVFLTGVLGVRDWDNGTRAGTSVDIEATAIGHDLSWGHSVFTRTVLVKEPEPRDKDYIAESERVKELEQELKNLRDTLASLAEGE